MMGANIKLRQMTDNGTYGAFYHTLEAVFFCLQDSWNTRSESQVNLNQEGCTLFLSELYFTLFNREYFDLLATSSVLCVIVKLH